MDVLALAILLGIIGIAGAIVVEAISKAINPTWP